MLLLGDLAIKWKKPVRLGFVDFGELAQRRSACEREVELNSRLAPDVYLGVAEVELWHEVAVEYLVVMRRLPAERRLAALAEAGSVESGQLEDLASMLSSFHDAAERSEGIDREGTAPAVLDRWRRNAAELDAALDDEAARALNHEVLDLAVRYVEGRAGLFASRIERGRVCDGHGDLLADDVYLLADGPRVLDCLEFDDALRFGDALSDVAFLAMDLEHLGHAELAARFLSAYRVASGDEWPASLLEHYLAYRAQVRAKVWQLRHLDGEPGASARAASLLELARRHLSRASPCMVLVGGLPGSGKSTLSDAIAGELDARVLRTDELRELVVPEPAALASPRRFGEWPYSPEARDAAYRAMFGAARATLAAGRSVVLDATFSDERWRRAAARLAADLTSRFSAVHCVAPPRVLRRRLAARRPGSSQATGEVATGLRRIEDPWDRVWRLDSTGPVEEVRRRALRRIRAQLWPECLDGAGGRLAG